MNVMQVLLEINWLVSQNKRYIEFKCFFGSLCFLYFKVNCQLVIFSHVEAVGQIDITTIKCL